MGGGGDGGIFDSSEKLPWEPLDNIGIYSCPEDSSSVLPYPSSFGVSVAVAATSVAVGVMILQRYDLLRTGDLLLRLDATSGKWWVGVFVSTGLRALVWSLLLGISSIYNSETATGAMIYTNFAMHALADLFLSLALHHQHVFRNVAGAVLDGGSTTGAVDPFGRNYDDSEVDDVNSDSTAAESRHVVVERTIVRSVCVLLCVLRCVMGGLADPELQDHNAHDDVSNGTSLWFSVYVGSVALQHLPILFYLGCILFAQHGPAPLSRVILAAAYVLNLPYTLPWRLWYGYVASSAIEAHPCPLHVLSWFDLVVLAHALGTGLYLLFIAREHRRAEEGGRYFMIHHTAA